MIGFYFPMALTAILLFPQSYWALQGKKLLTFLLPIAFSLVILTFFQQYDLIVYMILGNFFYYLMWVATIFTASRYQKYDV